MILTGIGIIDSLTALDPDAQAFISAAGITNATEKTAINNLVVDMKAAGIWSQMIAVYPLVGGSASSQKYNLINPQDTDAAYRLTFSGTWTHNSDGIRGSTTNSIANTYIFMGTDLDKFDMSIGWYARDSSVEGYINRNLQCANSTTANKKWQYYLNLGGGTSLGLQDPTEQYRSTFTSTANTQGTNYWTSTSISNSVVYLNKTLKNTNTQTKTNAVDNDVNWQLGQADNGFQNGCSFMFFGTAISETEYFDFVDIIQDFQTTLGRQV